MMRKAGRLEIGEYACADAMDTGGVRLLMLASDAPEKLVRRADALLEGRRALLVPLPYTREELSRMLGREGCGMLAATDFGLSAAFMNALAQRDAERYGALSREMGRRAEKAAKRKAAGKKANRGGNADE